MTHDAQPKFRTALLSTTSSVALVLFLAGASASEAAPADHTTVWVELGGELDGATGQPDLFLPSFTPAALEFGLPSPAAVQGLSKYSFAEVGKLELDPADSAWTFSASVSYGRSTRKQYLHKELTVPPYIMTSGARQVYRGYSPQHRTADYKSEESETHDIIDFAAGKDVGIGLMGRNSDAKLDFGVRFAQFSEKAVLGLRADPNPHFAPQVYDVTRHRFELNTSFYQSYRVSPTIEHDFRGIGPSLSWSESIPLAGHDDDTGQITLDWGANASILFGRQRVRVQHHTSSDLYKRNIWFNTGNDNFYGLSDQRITDFSASAKTRSVISPNVGATAALTFRMPRAKISFGYRADFFFNAIDKNIDAHTSTTRGFYGPFATVSFGLGN